MRPTRQRSGWIRLSHAGAGGWAFLLHRLSGLVLTAYLVAHLVLLNQLRGGPSHWDAFVAMMSSPLAFLLDALLIGTVAFHGLNGIRVGILGLGKGLRWEGSSSWVVLGLAIGVSVVSSILLLGHLGR